MQFADHKNFKDQSEDIGLAVISQISSIRAMAKMDIPLVGIIALETIISEITCCLWSLLPMSLETKHGDEYKNQCDHLHAKVATFIGATKAMAELIRKDTEKK